MIGLANKFKFDPCNYENDFYNFANFHWSKYIAEGFS